MCDLVPRVLLGGVGSVGSVWFGVATGLGFPATSLEVSLE
jgi:hypothetical protein